MVALVLVLAVAPAGAGGAGEGEEDCGDGHTLTWSPTKVWPPNHKYVDVTLTYSDAEATHDLSLQVVAAEHNENVDGDELNGAGNTDNDTVFPAGAAMGTGSVSVTVQVRSERSGRGEGRTYSINWEAQSNTGTDDMCSGTATVFVPHDCRDGGGKDIIKN